MSFQISPSDELAFCVHIGLSSKGRWRILKDQWEQKLSFAEFEVDSRKYDAYFKQYEDQCHQLATNDIGQLHHRHIVDALDLVFTETRSTCCQRLKTKIVDSAALFNLPKDIDAFVQRWLEFACRALLLVDVSSWPEDKTIHDHFQCTLLKVSEQQDKVKLPRAFNARNLNRIAGMTIRWTNILSEHLRLEPDDIQVAVFHQSYVLDLFLHKGLLPASLVHETRQSLSLLLPRFDGKVATWFRSQSARPERNNLLYHLVPRSLSVQAVTKTVLDPTASTLPGLRVAERRLEKFKYWRDRLIILKEAYDDHEPQGIVQFWRDDRKSFQWWAFWVALVVFIFAVIQCVEGALQVYKAYHPSPPP